MSIWINKYAPKTLSEVKGQNTALEKLKSYVSNHKRGVKPLLIHGPQGVGKTSSVYALANENDYEIVEVNASDLRNADSINSVLGAAIKQQSLFAKKKIILVDEIDGLAGREDRGGVAAINSLVEKSSFPAILVANDPYKKNIASLRKKCELQEYHGLAYTSILSYLKKICQKEGIKADDEALTSLARSVGGDMRAAINDLQSFSYNNKLTKKDLDLAYSRDHTEKIINALVRVFKTTSAAVAISAFDDVQEDLDEIFLWIEENIPKEYTKAEDLAEAFTNLAMADVFKGRIRKWQYYRFYVYCYNLLSAGIALSKEEKYPGFTSYKPTTRILRIWMANQKNAKKKAIAQKLARKTHTSTKRAVQSDVLYLKTIFKKNKQESERISNFLELDKDEVAWLKS
ncbi:replication factor C large subunit [Candidatus Woesearchaeota archaeon]|nr:replication factor C large subunit [Candidatus Woesearchaeota archaeon]